jgi:hypothetical protein
MDVALERIHAPLVAASINLSISFSHPTIRFQLEMLGIAKLKFPSEKFCR